MNNGAAIYLSSDCEQVAERMKLIVSKSEYFSLIKTNCTISINWKSETEINLNKYEV